MRRLAAWLWGALEFRSDVTRHYDDTLIESYDRGRAFAHRVTRRRYER